MYHQPKQLQATIPTTPTMPPSWRSFAAPRWLGQSAEWKLNPFPREGSESALLPQFKETHSFRVFSLWWSSFLTTHGLAMSSSSSSSSSSSFSHISRLLARHCFLSCFPSVSPHFSHPTIYSFIYTRFPLSLLSYLVSTCSIRHTCILPPYSPTLLHYLFLSPNRFGFRFSSSSKGLLF